MEPYNNVPITLIHSSVSYLWHSCYVFYFIPISIFVLAVCYCVLTQTNFTVCVIYIKNWILILILSPNFRPLSFMWQKKDAEFPPQVRPDGAYLRFEALNKSDNGVYLCHADNGIGWNEGSYILLVQGNEQISEKGTDNRTETEFSFCFQLLLLSFI